jgi:hypothetical protein
MPRRSRGVGAVLTVAGLVLVAVAFAVPKLRANAGSIIPVLIAASILGGLAVAYWRHAGSRPAEDYRKRHQRLAGPRPGAHLPS